MPGARAASSAPMAKGMHFMNAHVLHQWLKVCVHEMHATSSAPMAERTLS